MKPYCYCLYCGKTLGYFIKTYKNQSFRCLYCAQKQGETGDERMIQDTSTEIKQSCVCSELELRSRCMMCDRE